MNKKTIPKILGVLLLIAGLTLSNFYASYARINNPEDISLKANIELDNLSGVAINTSLISDTAGTDDLGSEALFFNDLYLKDTIQFEGATDNDFQLILTLVDPTTPDKTQTFADITGTVVTTAGANANVDIGAYDLRGQTLTADGLTSGRVIFAGASGVLSDDVDFTFSGAALTLGSDGTDGQLNLFSEIGATDYTASLFAHVTMTSDASFYLPADEPVGTYLLNMTTGGVIGYDSSTYLTGNQTITLSGDVSGSGATAITTAIVANVVDFADIKYDNTLAGNPALLVDECYFISTATGGGFICEGSIADTSEQIYQFPDVNGVDTTNFIVVDNAQVTDLEGTGLSITTGTLNAEVQTSDLHAEVTITGEDFLSLSTQQITANAINPDNLANTDFGGFTCNGTNCSIDNATFTTALTVNTGAITLTGNAGGSTLTLGAGASSISGANTGDGTYLKDLTTGAGLTGGGDNILVGSDADVELSLSHLGIESLTDPASDRIWIWDDTDNAVKHAVIGTGLTYTAATDTLSASGYTNLTSFVDQTAWRVFYSNTDGDVVELALGADGTYLESNGVAVAPTWSVPAGAGDVSKVGTPIDNQVGVWTGDGTIEGTAGLTYDGSNFLLTGDIGSTGSKITKGWFTDLLVTNAISGAVTGNAGTVTNATFTTALTVDTGTLTLTANVANNSVLTIGAGASSISGANTGDQTTISGNAGSATVLQTPRDIGGVSFDGSASIVPTTIVVADTEDATTLVGLWTDATGSLLPKTDEQLTYVANTGVLTAAGFVGPLTGAVTGNASTATALALNPGDCGANTWAQSIDAEGDLTCAAVTYAGITAMTSANFAGIISNESGTGVVAFTTDPVFTTPNLGTPSTLVLTNATALPTAQISAGTLAAGVLASDHGAAATDMLINVSYGTGAAPTANTTTIGSIYITYTE